MLCHTGSSMLIKEDNQQISNININDRQEIVIGNEDKIVGCRYDLTENENRTDYDTFNLSKTQNIHDEQNISMPISKIAYATDLSSTKSLQQIQTSIKSIESIQTKDSMLNRTELVLF